MSAKKVTTKDDPFILLDEKEAEVTGRIAELKAEAKERVVEIRTAIKAEKVKLRKIGQLRKELTAAFSTTQLG